MRLCEFCSGSVNDTTNTCTGCGAAQSTQPAAPAVPASASSSPADKVSVLWMVWVFIPWLSGIGLIWIGSQAKKNAWIVEGAIYLLPLVSSMVSGEEGVTDVETGWAIIFWIASIVRGFMLKPAYEASMRANQ